jgi:hypothetical protein
VASVRTRLLFIGGPLLAAAIGAAIVVAVGRSTGDGPGDPARFMTNLVEQIAGNDYAGAWQTLHPAHQRVATRAAYVDCESQSPIPGKLASVQVIDVRDERVRIAGSPTMSDGKAVRLRVSIAGAGEPVVLTHTGHAVAVGGHWTWILPPERFAEYEAGRCPA